MPGDMLNFHVESGAWLAGDQRVRQRARRARGQTGTGSWAAHRLHPHPIAPSNWRWSWDRRKNVFAVCSSDQLEGRLEFEDRQTFRGTVKGAVMGRNAGHAGILDTQFLSQQRIVLLVPIAFGS
jgi:hypothetical protein